MRAPPTLALVATLAALAGAACPPTPSTCQVKQSLVDHDAWELVALADDPWGDVAPGPLVEKNADAGVPPEGTLTLCAGEDVTQELLAGEPSLQLSTLFCSWATVEQPLPVAVTKGEMIHTRVWYFAQTSYPAATAELALTIGDAPFFTSSIAIPADSDLLGGDFEAPDDAPAGTPIRWHIGNHGGNSWNLIELSVLRDAPCPPEEE